MKTSTLVLGLGGAVVGALSVPIDGHSLGPAFWLAITAWACGWLIGRDFLLRDVLRQIRGKR